MLHNIENNHVVWPKMVVKWLNISLHLDNNTEYLQTISVVFYSLLLPALELSPKSIDNLALVILIWA